MIEDVLNPQSVSSSAWSRVNAAEAIPGVSTPASATLWEYVGERAYRLAFSRLGLIPKSACKLATHVDEQYVAPFYGRWSTNLDMFNWVLSALPGSSGAGAREGFFASSGLASQRPPASPLRRLWVSVRVRVYMWGLAQKIRRSRSQSKSRWQRGLQELADADLAAARQVLRGTFDHLIEEIAEQLDISTIVVSGISAALQKIAARAGSPERYMDLISGYGGTEEGELTEDLRALAQNELSLQEFVDKHGFHAPADGQLSSFSWREDVSPVRELIRTLGRDGRQRAPHAGQDGARLRRLETERALMSKLSLTQRIAARRTFARAQKFMPLRTVTKASFTQTFDLARAALRRIGVQLAASNQLDDPNDVFFLSLAEVLELPPDPRATVAHRKDTYRRYSALDIPMSWVGVPEPIVHREEAAQARPEGSVSAAPQSVRGIGVSSGTVDGIAQVFSADADTSSMREGAVLICHITDPSWAGTMMLASAVVVDVGGMLSHGAIVARELGIPCVVNTAVATRVFRTGDRVRVDGTSGTVSIID